MDYKKRLAKLRNTIEFEALLIGEPIDIFYLTGLDLSTGKLVITQKEACLIVDGRYSEIAAQQKLYRVMKLDEGCLKNWLSSHSIGSLVFDSHSTSYQEYTTLQSKLDPIQLSPLPSPIAPLRMIKDQDEIAVIRHAAQLCYQGYLTVTELLKTGISEEELALELELFWKKRDGKKLSFDPIIAFGPNSSMPHYRAGKAKLAPNTSVLIDIGVTYNHYQSDMTRVVFYGDAGKEIETIYSIVAEAKARAIDLCRPGTLIGDLDKAARGWITECGYGDQFSHSLGHGVGLEVHEAPCPIRSQGLYASTPLQPGMVITIEPGIYLPGVGGVRLEDTVLIVDNGCEILTVG